MHRVRRINKDKVALLLSLFLLLSLEGITKEEASALSPSFSRQTIGDDPGDWSYLRPSSILPFDKERCKEAEKDFEFPDLLAVDYFSDGERLNTTLWFTSGINKPSPTVITNFQILIDVNSVYDTGQDYLLKIEWDKLKQNWTRTLQDISPSSGKNRIIDFGEYRVLENDDYLNNNASFFEKGKNYVELDVALNSISSPDQYSLVFMSTNSFYTVDNRYFCQVVDISDRVHVPPPNVRISLSPSSLDLRPEEKKTVELHLRSSSMLDSHVVLDFGRVDNNTEVVIDPREVTVPSTGIAVSHIHVKAPKNAEPKLSTIPILANITFPTAITNQLSGQIANNSASASIYKYSNLTTNILKPVTITEEFGTFWQELGIPISGFLSLITVVAGGVSSLVFYVVKKNRKKNQKPPSS